MCNGCRRPSSTHFGRNHARDGHEATQRAPSPRGQDAEKRADGLRNGGQRGGLLRNEFDRRVVVGDAGAVSVTAGEEDVALRIEHLDVAGAEWGAVHLCAQLAVA